MNERLSLAYHLRLPNRKACGRVTHLFCSTCINTNLDSKLSGRYLRQIDT